MNSDQIFKTAIKTRKLRKPCLQIAKKHKVSFNELEILKLVFDKPGITPADISRGLCIESAIVSRKLKILSDKNFITYKRNNTDRRVINIEISVEGKRITKKILAAIEKYVPR